MLAKNWRNRNKMDNKAKSNNKTLILCRLYKLTSMNILSLSNSNEYISAIEPLKIRCFGDFQEQKTLE